MSDWPTELATAIREALASGEERTITVPSGTRKALAEIALGRMADPAEISRIKIEVQEQGR